MKSTANIGLGDVQAVYSGPEGQLWELVMGQQIHIGGFRSSMELAEKAGIGPGMTGVDLCCCNGAGMRFLVRFRNVARMHGVDATATVVQQGRTAAEAEGLADRIAFTLGDACQTGLPDASADFVWGEDAWCYVTDKKRLVAEAVRLLKPRRHDCLHRLDRRPNGLHRRRVGPLSDGSRRDVSGEGASSRRCSRSSRAPRPRCHPRAAQAPAPGVHHDRHHQRAVHLWRRLRRPRQGHRRAHRAQVHRLPRRRWRGQPGRTPRCSATSCPRT